MPGRTTFFPNPTKTNTFAAAPSVSTPLIRNQGRALREGGALGAGAASLLAVAAVTLSVGAREREGREGVRDREREERKRERGRGRERERERERERAREGLEGERRALLAAVRSPRRLEPGHGGGGGLRPPARGLACHVCIIYIYI